MHSTFTKKTPTLTFRRWSRRSYAVFNSLDKVIRIAVLCLVCSILALPGHTQQLRDSLQPVEPIDSQQLDEVVVSAQMAPVVQSQLMRMVQVISRTEIEQSPAADLATLLETIRGVDIRKRGTYGMQADIGIRGGTFDQTLILLNGINITDPQTGHHNLNLPVDLNSIERIEILQGAGARIFGPNAFSGAINIITRAPGTRTIHSTISAGQHKFNEAAVSAGLKTFGVKHFLSGASMSSDGFTQNTDFISANIFWHAAAPVGKSTLNLQAGHNRKAFGANSFYTPRFPNQFEATRTSFAAISLKTSSRFSITPTLYWRRHHDRFELFRDEAPAWYTTHNYHMTDVAGATLNASYPSALGITSLGLDYRLEHIYSNVLGNLLPEPLAVSGYDQVFFTRSYQRTGFSIMAEHTLYHGPFSASAGLLTWFNTDLDKGFSFFPGLDLGWQLTPQWRWYASINRTLRLPTFTDLFYSGPANIGNALLKPEEAVSMESGFKSRLWGAQTEVALFRRLGTNMIDWIKQPGDEQWRSMNLTKVNLTGLEAGADIPLEPITGSRLSNVSFHYTRLWSSKTSGDFISNYALDHLRHKLDLSLTHPITTRAGASYRVSWQQREGGYMNYRDGAFEAIQPFAPYWMIDVRVFYNLGQMKIFSEVTNLFNTPTVSIANVPQPGRWVRVGISGKVAY
jgi:vitamin B12 transporter